jgi:hypothetical protein
VHRIAVRTGVAAGSLASAFFFVVVLGAAPASAVDTDMAISSTAIDFGDVAIGATAGPTSVTLTNTGGDPFGPINIFGGAPPTAEFNASQNCQGTTLPAGGSCTVNYTFSPAAGGTFNDTSSFTISETNSQSDGEDFSVTLHGTSGSTNTTTTDTAATTTTTTVAPTTPTNPPGNPAPGGQSPAPIGNAPVGGTPTTVAQALPEATVEREKAAPGQEQQATVRGYEPTEVVTATEEPDKRDLGSQVANANGEVTFTWIIAETDTLGSHEFIATGPKSGVASARYAVVATAAEAEASDDSGLSPWLIALIVIVVLGAIAAGVFYAYRRGRSTGGPHSADPSAPGAPPEPPEPEAPTQPVPQV